MNESGDTGASTQHEDDEMLKRTVDNIDAMVAYWDGKRVCRYANRAYRAWYALTSEGVVGQTMKGLLGGALYAKNLSYINRAYRGERQVFEREIVLPDGKTRNSLVTYTPDISDGEVEGMIVHIVDVTPLKQLERELQRARAKAEEIATHDYLTGLPNRVTLMDRISGALSRAKRNGEVVAVMTVDMDRFKVINDTYGHGAGDALLIEVAKRMRSAVRESDTVTRYGGDEFLILAPQVESETHAQMMADRLLGHVRPPVKLAEAVVEPTFSIGISLYPIYGTTPKELIAQSDRALYAAKRLGKNQYAVFSGEDADASDRRIS